MSETSNKKKYTKLIVIGVIATVVLLALLLINPIVDSVIRSDRVECKKNGGSDSLASIKKDKKKYFKYLKEHNEYQKAYNWAVNNSMKSIMDSTDNPISFKKWIEDEMKESITDKDYDKVAKIAESTNDEGYKFVSKVLIEKWPFDKFFSNCPFGVVTMEQMDVICEYYTDTGDNIYATDDEDDYGTFHMNSFFGKLNHTGDEEYGFEYDFKPHVGEDDEFGADDKVEQIVVKCNEKSDKKMIKRRKEWLKVIKKAFGIKKKDMKIKIKKKKHKESYMTYTHYKYTYKWKKDGKKYTFITDYSRDNDDGAIYSNGNTLYVDTVYHK